MLTETLNLTPGINPRAMELGQSWTLRPAADRPPVVRKGPKLGSRVSALRDAYRKAGSLAKTEAVSDEAEEAGLLDEAAYAAVLGAFGEARNPVQAEDVFAEAERHYVVPAMAPLVKRVAFEMRLHLPPQVKMDDLVGAGTLGLVDALRELDPSRKVKLESYARHRVRGAILDALRTPDAARRNMRRRVRKVEKTYRELEARLGRPVQGEEVARALGISLKVWHRWAQEVHSLGFDALQNSETAAAAAKLPVKEEGRAAVRRLTEDPFDPCYRREQRDLVNRALEGLPEQERLIITLYYQHDLTMKEIASRLAVDESRVSQLHAEALQRLKARVQASLSSPRKVNVQMVRRSGLSS